MNYSTEKTEKYSNNERQKTSEKLTPNHKSKTQGLWIDRQGNFVPFTDIESNQTTQWEEKLLVQSLFEMFQLRHRLR